MILSLSQSLPAFACKVAESTRFPSAILCDLPYSGRRPTAPPSPSSTFFISYVLQPPLAAITPEPTPASYFLSSQSSPLSSSCPIETHSAAHNPHFSSTPLQPRKPPTTTHASTAYLPRLSDDVHQLSQSCSWIAKAATEAKGFKPIAIAAPSLRFTFIDSKPSDE